MQLQVLSNIPDSTGNYWTQVHDTKNYYVFNLPKISKYGAGIQPAGMDTSTEIFLSSPGNPKLLITVDGKQSNTPEVATSQGSVNDYKWDAQGNVLGSNSPAMENICICMKTDWNSSSIENFGLNTRKLIPQNYQNIISNDIRSCIQPVIDAGLLDPNTLQISITKQGSSIFAKMSFVDTMAGLTTQTYQLL
jgi:hypothetical protein